jgi:hypothetical protein
MVVQYQLENEGGKEKIEVAKDRWGLTQGALLHCRADPQPSFQLLACYCPELTPCCPRFTDAAAVQPAVDAGRGPTRLKRQQRHDETLDEHRQKRCEAAG